MEKCFPNRSSGVLMPIFALPSPHGIGTLGKDAYDFVDFLVKSGQSYWQVLPLGHTGYGNSPYQVYSTVAGNPNLIDLDELVEEGLLLPEEVWQTEEAFEENVVNYEKLAQTKELTLRQAWQRASKELLEELENFKKANEDWLKDYAVFMALRNYFHHEAVWNWEDQNIKRRTPESMLYYDELLKEEINFYEFIQYVFFKQMLKLKKYANEKGVQLIGDIPIYPSPDSCDVWANPDLFKVDDTLLPSGIAGVPPDYYSEVGQVWGNPVYDWDVHEAQKYWWWTWRMKHAFEIADIVRIDHFRGFQNYWEVPAGEKTAVNGKWMPGPRMKLFEAIREALGEVPIIAEDLGIIGDDVREFLKETGYPGMRVMVFGLSESEDSNHLPHNWPVNCVGYSSTHDSETFCQKVLDELSEEDKSFALRYIHHSSEETIGMSAIYSCLASPAFLSIIPMQDLLSLGAESRMNVPNTVGNHNWSWRMRKDALTEELIESLYRLTKTYKRI